MKLIGIVVCVLPILACLIVILRKEHKDRKKRERLCTFMVHHEVKDHKCGMETRRCYKMVPKTRSDHESIFVRRSFRLAIKEALGRHFAWYAFDICPQGHVVFVKPKTPGEEKFFWFYVLWWKHVTDSRQFDPPDTLFEAAGLIPEAVLPLNVRVKAHAKLRSGPTTAGLHLLKMSESGSTSNMKGGQFLPATKSGTSPPKLRPPHNKFPRGQE